jgi:hypothetical protein
MPHCETGGIDLHQGRRPWRAPERGIRGEFPMARRPVPTEPALTEDHLLRLGAALSGAVLSASAALAADLARGHMAQLSDLCGVGTHPHCGWCYATAALALAGFAAFVGALRPASLSQIKAKLPGR